MFFRFSFAISSCASCLGTFFSLLAANQPEYFDLTLKYGLDPALKPEIQDITETRCWLGYDPQYSLKNLLEELKEFGAEGPPIPIF